MTQEGRVLQALRQARTEGINSYTAREELHIIQLPARVWGLKAKGHLITERTNPDKSVTYFLISSPVVKPVLEPIGHFCGDTYRNYPEVGCGYCQPRQESFL